MRSTWSGRSFFVIPHKAQRQFAAFKTSKRLSAPLKEVLSPFRSIDLAESNLYLLPMDQDRDRVPVCDAYDPAFECAGVAQEDAGEEESEHQGSSLS